ncbi:Uma2 family endonuclease [Litoribacter alkaliphilus]|uniref:Uma2 family endonuclease n=1 Tax=Litoribacter ruber TaxID=702568 RepID=A0AAP2CF76_9BACT|nr:Uma2 family endonuclease [Litoribacter alkaliphilus]MBS9522580.1 Uma2 family endonuclease [Litoribacter alkaliphilus]
MKKNTNLEESFTEYGRYSYADYLTWEIDGMVELIKGRVFKQVAAPRRKHQEIVLLVGSKLLTLFEHRICKVFVAPFDVRLPSTSPKDEKIFTVVQPDICVVCDPAKLDDAGCVGAPDLIVEVLAPGNNKKELKYKYEVYQESGVKEYWIIQPEMENLMVYTLKQGEYVASRLFTRGDVVKSSCIKGIELDLEEVFGRVG